MIELQEFGPNIRNVFYNGIEVVKHLKRELGNEVIVLGPAIPVVRRINNRYHCEIMVKYKESNKLNQVMSEIMENYQLSDNFIAIDRFPDVG